MSRIPFFLAATAAFTVLAACQSGTPMALLKSAGTSQSANSSSERDIEAPEEFATTEAGIWDGRPTRGGVWVAHPDVRAPERAIIRNESNGRFVIGGLFDSETTEQTPRLRVSSEAAAALGLKAGQPSNLYVVALRREGAQTPSEPVAVTQIPAQGTTITPEPLPAAPIAQPPAKPYVQVGIFSVEENAQNTAAAMRRAGMLPTIKTHRSQNKRFWRVVVGPAKSADDLAMVLRTIREAGFADAYAVTH